MGFLQQAGKTISSSKSSGGFLQQAGVSNLSENTKTTPTPKKTEPISKPITATTPAKGFLSQATSTASRLIGDIKMTLAPKKQEIISPVPDSQLIPQSSNPIRIKPDQKKIAKDVIKQIFPQTVENVKQIANDPLAMKDTRMQARKDTWEAIKQPVVTAFQNSLQDYVNPPKTQAQKTARTLTKVTDIAGVAFIPLSAIFTMAEHVPVVGSFIKAITTAVAIAPSEGARAISNKIIDELPINQQAKDSLKPAVGDMAGLVAQIVTGKFIEVGSKKSASIIKEVGLDRFEKMTKDTIESTGSPKTINLTKTQVRDVLRGLGSEQAKRVFKDLGVSDRIKAVKEGLTIQIPAEKIVRIIDKPYWEKIKSVFNIEATDVMKVDKGTATTTAGFAGYLTDGTYTPAEVSAKIIGSPFENTPEGRAVMKTVLEAQQTGRDITVQQEKVVKGPSPTVNKPSRGVVEQGSVEPQGTKETVAKDYTTASDYADAKYSATETQQIGEIDPNRITPRDPVDKTSREYKALMEDIKTNGMKDPVRVTVEDGKITTTDGSQRSSIARDLGIKARVIVNSGSIDGLGTIKDEYASEIKRAKDDMDLMEEARKYNSVDQFIKFMRGSATQYGDYNPKFRAKYGLAEDSARLGDLGINPEAEVTIYRGIADVDIKNAKIVDGDFVTTDYDSAKSYAGDSVVSKKVKAKDLIADSASEFDKADPFPIGAEFVYSDSKNKLINYTKSQLVEIYNKARKVEKTEVEKEADASLLTSDMAKQEAMKATPQSEKATAELKKIQEDIQQAQAENQMKKSILDQFSTSEIRAIRAIKRSVASLEAKGQDITGVAKTDSYQAYIENVMSAIKTDSEDVALQYIINDIPDAITSASTREDLQRIRVLKSRIQPKEVVVNKSQLPTGEGKVRVSRLEARMKGVLKKATPQQIEDLGLSTYNQMNRKETIERAVEYVTTSPADALQVLKGSMEAPEGIPPEAIYVALTQEAKTDLTLATKLASLQATMLGQRLSLLAELDPNSPVKLMNEVYQLREKAMKKRYKSENVKQVREKVVKEIKKRVKAPDKYEWKSFIDSIDTC